MGVQSTLHVTDTVAKKIFEEIAGETVAALVLRRLDDAGFEKLLDRLLSESFYNVLLIDQESMDKAWANPNSRQFGNYDPSGSTLRFQLEQQLEEREPGHLMNCFKRVASSPSPSRQHRYCS